MNEKFDYKNSLTDIKASLFDIYEDQERVIGSINPDLRDKHVSEFIEVKDLALSLLEKIQKLYDNSLVSVKDNNEGVVSTNINSVDNMPEYDVDNNEEVNNQDVENNTLEDDQVSNDEKDEEELNQDNNDIDEDNIQTTDEVETSDESSLDNSSDDESVQDNSDTGDDNTQTDDDDETPDEASLDDSSDDQDTEEVEEKSDLEESKDDDNDSDSDSEISFDNVEDNSNKYYLLCDEDKLHFAYVSENLFNKIKNHHVSDTEPLEEDTVSDEDTSDGNIYKKDDLPVKGIIVRNDQYMKLALSKHRQEGVLKEAKNYRIETVKRKRQEQQKIELEKAKVHLDI
mgnify:CR=1 FL=1